MRFLHCVPLLVLLTGCSVRRGQIDFVFPPLLELPLGEYRAILVFRDSTVLKIGGTHYTLLIPAWALLSLFLVFVSFVVWIIYRRQRHDKDSI